MILESKYNFSFTATTLRMYDFMRLVEHVSGREGEININDISVEFILGKNNVRTSRREMQELLKRYNSLTSLQRKLLSESGSEMRKQLALIGTCKSNKFLYDFIVEVVREKVLVYDYTLQESDFVTFVNRKSELHPELEEFAVSTMKKAKQHLFKILEEGGIINDIKLKQIQQQWLDQKLTDAIVKDDPRLLQIFLLSERDIQMAIAS